MCVDVRGQRVRRTVSEVAEIAVAFLKSCVERFEAELHSASIVQARVQTADSPRAGATDGRVDVMMTNPELSILCRPTKSGSPF